MGSISRETTLLDKYNLTLDAYQALEDVQNGCCRICLRHKSDVRQGILVVDHDHRTNKVRGLLCHNCNTAIGLFKEDQTALLRAIQYLKRNL